MTRKTPAPAPKKYKSGPSGSHTKPTIAFRPEPEELEEITRAAEREGVTRNDWLRFAALEKLDREKTSRRSK